MRTRPTPRLALLAAVLSAVVAAGPAPAQTPAPAPAAPAPGEAARAMTGAPWEFSNADRDRRCAVTFRTEAAGPAGAPGMKIELEKACTSVFPFLREVVAWTLAEHDFLRFVDAKGKALLEFSEVEHGIYEALKAGEGILFLQTVASLKRPPPSLDEMAGAWTITRAGRPLCGLMLATAPVPDGFALRLASGCDPAIARFAPIAWHMDRDELILTGARNQSWRFEETDPKTWQRVPETRDPIQMVKQ